MATSIKQDGADAALAGALGSHASLSTAPATAATEADSDESVAGRVAVSWTYAAGEGGAVRKASNTARVRFSFASAQSGTLRSVQIWDAASGGNLKTAIDLDTAISGVGAGSTVDFNAGDLILQVSNA